VAGEIRTARLLLIPGEPDMLRAELDSLSALGARLGVEIPPDWPPEYYDADAIRWTLGAIDDGRITPEWGFYYVVETAAGGASEVLVGLVGFKGPPADGSVEVGYGVITQRRRRGYACEAVGGLLRKAFDDAQVGRVIAHTLRELAPSIGVLEKLGFRFAGPGHDPSEPDAIQYEITRAAYETRTMF
jgi:[ribosomal protein S5]-alanine N-acetyltransferase